MTELLERAVSEACKLPDEEQDEIARAILLYFEPEPVRLSSEERAAVERSRAAAARGEFATDEEVEAIWTRRRSNC